MSRPANPYDNAFIEGAGANGEDQAVITLFASSDTKNPFVAEACKSRDYC